MTSRSYGSAAAFKAALEHRLRTATSTAASLNRRRQMLVFDRFVARVQAVFGDTAVLKGGFVLELRVERPRTTKDIDLGLAGSPEQVLERLQQAGRTDLDDFLSFEVQRDPEHPDIQAEGMVYEGLRFRAECRLAGKIYGQRFGIDVAFGDPILGAPDSLVGDDVLGFAGIAPPVLRVIPVETHIAEKLHAYTLPRTRPNSRIKDLPDLALLATVGTRDAARVRAAVAQTFHHRGTHPPPQALPDPPAAWLPPYQAMARTDELPWKTLEEVAAAARAFLDPVLGGASIGTWTPEDWSWSPA